MIGKVLRGTRVDRLLYYLYGPGKANEHTDPHLVAGFRDPAELEPESRSDGSRDFRRLAGLLAQPLAALAGPGYDKPVWHCAVRAAPGDRMLSDAEWAQVSAEIMHRTGLAPRGDDAGVRWVAVRHAGDHVHIVATLARQDGYPAAHLERLLPGPRGVPGGREAVRAARNAARRPHRRPAPVPGGDGAGRAARLGRAAPGRAAAARVHRGGRGTHRGGVLRRARGGRCAGPQAVQHHPPW